MTGMHALYQASEREALLIDLPVPRPRRPTSRAVVIPALGSPQATTVKVTTKIGDKAELEEQAEALESGPVVLPVTVGDDVVNVTVTPVEATKHIQFETSSGVNGVLFVDNGDQDEVEASANALVFVAVVAILVIGAMVVATEGGSFSGSWQDVHVEAEGGAGEGGD
jgi:hypothetical protein